jgi:molybdopterin synthase sulfur carrier subunit|tara:strand:- start:136528 stop:136785 length:258 start_codon:yes stop_codon:yes gene_type:complete
MNIRLVYFARVRETIGKDGETREFDSSVTCVAEALTALRAEGETYRIAFQEPEKLRFALDHQFVDVSAKLHEGAELGIFPPVTGG